MTPRKAWRGFTLIEVMIVAAILALTAVMTLPKGFFFLDPPMRILRRTVTEAADLALDGRNVRLRLEAERGADRGKVVVEALVMASDQPQSAPEWKPAEVRYPLDGEEWNLSPEIVYFYPDGTCTPARVTYAARGVRLTDGDSAFLTVTGFLFEVLGSTH
ncbi:MAG: prepilin-type N-terminal cleavage/methylation domain-containing protein [Synergistaceae bacterium]|jgi:prepilin-type N-terminal cleavage/methylation domain-containing protein|nr:prepilin-type N-terminal cleavage/methylation domain-containing protein [Synergistaceae bacterium]